MSNKVLGFVEHVSFGMHNNEMMLELVVETYLHGKHTFFFAVEQLKPMLGKYNIPDITMFSELPVILEFVDGNAKFVDFPPCRRLGYDTTS